MFRTPGGPAFSPAVQELVEELIEFLNLDLPDPDLEDGGDDEKPAEAEPALGSTQMANQERWSDGGHVSKWDIDREQDNSDKEPSLAALHHQTNQENWSRGGTDEREGDEHDGREPDEDGEPSLGSFDRMIDQRKSWRQHHGPSTAWAVTDGEADDDLEDNGGR